MAALARGGGGDQTEIAGVEGDNEAGHFIIVMCTLASFCFSVSFTDLKLNWLLSMDLMDLMFKLQAINS